MSMVSVLCVGHFSVVPRVVGGVGDLLVSSVRKEDVVFAFGHVAVPLLTVAEELRLFPVATVIGNFVTKTVMSVFVLILLEN